jgi:hypothetical protein
MATIHFDHSRGCRLKLIFDRKVESFNLADGATYGDIAAKLDGLTNQSRGKLNAIDVTLDRPLPKNLPFPELFDPRHKERVMLEASPMPTGAVRLA